VACRAAKEIRENHPETAVLVLSQYVEEGYALELLQEGAEGVGYLLKDRVYDLTDFVAAVKRVAERLRARSERRLATRGPATA
jgi:DNA-binding NarL/FixJ family response regulator